MYRIHRQQTYRGRTAGGWLKRARVVRCAAGNYEVATPDLPYHVLVVTEDGEMVLDNGGRATICLTMSVRAARKLRRLKQEAERLMLDAYGQGA
jgi:hypothetical protein